jgi:hypothetical protein
MEIEIEWDLMEVQGIYEDILRPAGPEIVLAGQERSNWENAATQGRLLRKTSWRWQGRYDLSGCLPVRRCARRAFE